MVGFFRVGLKAPWYDVIFFQRAVFPFGLERFIRILNRNIVYDLDDAIYLPVEQGKGFLRRMKGVFKRKQVEGILRVSAHCICENSYIKSFVEKFCPRVSIITGPIDAKRNFVQIREREMGSLTIGWVGSPATSMYLDTVWRPLRDISKKYNIHVKLIGVRDYHIDGVNVISKDWSYETEVEEIQSFDIGVCPMPDDEWTRGKVSIKILQYMANGVPMVASYTPTNEEIIRDGVDGFIAHSEKEWVEKLTILIVDPALRKKMGLMERKKAEEKYSLDVAASVFLRILEEVNGPS